MLREMVIRSREDLIAARELIRNLARQAGCDPVIEARLVAGLSDLAERFYHGAEGRMAVRLEGAYLEAVLEHGCQVRDAAPALAPADPTATESARTGAAEPADHGEGILLAIGSVRHMWDEVDVRPALDRGLKVVLRSWLK